MSYDLYLWRWASDSHVSNGVCYLLMAQGHECADASPLDARKLKVRAARRLSPIARASRGSLHFQVLPRGLVVQSHGVAPASLHETLGQIAREEGLVIFDPQGEPLDPGDEAAARTLIREELETDERAGLTRDLPSLRARAEAGDAQALVELGNRFYFGEAVPQDVAAAFRCYRAAAESGNPAGMLNLASCYRRGEGTDRDGEAAVGWYTRALDGDRVFAAFELGEMYEKGDGVLRDLGQAERYYSVALEGGHEDARKALRRIGVLPPLQSP